MTDAPPVLQLHDTGDPRFSLQHITDDARERIDRARDRPDTEVAIAEETVDGRTLYLFYERPPLDSAYPDFDSEEEVIEWLHEEFSDNDEQILYVVLNIFDEIIAETEASDTGFSTYKRMDLDECRLVGPAMNFFEQERAEQLRHLVSRCSRIPVVWSKPDIRQWVVRDKLVDGTVGFVVEPGGCNGSNVFFEAAE